MNMMLRCCEKCVCLLPNLCVMSHTNCNSLYIPFFSFSIR